MVVLNLSVIRKEVSKQVSARKEELLAFTGGFLLSCAPLAEGIHPFGIALLCASKKCRPTLLFGCVAALPFCSSGKLIQLLCLLGCFFALSSVENRGSGLHGQAKLRAYLSPAPAEREVQNALRMLLASAAALLTAFGSLFSVDATPADVVLAFALSISFPAFCWLFCQFLQKGRFYDLSLFGCAFALTQIFHGLSIAGVPLSLPAGAIFTLCAARNKGFAYGCAMGLLCGLTSGGAATGALGVTGITYGLLVSGSEGLALILAYMISVSGYWYLADNATVLPAAILLVLSCFAFLPLQKYVPQKLPPVAAPLKVQELRLEKYAAAFSSLSGLFYTVSENAAPQTTDQTVKGIQTVVNAFCRNCEGCDLQESELCNCFVDRMREQGIVHLPELPLHITRRCPSIRAMAKTVNNLPTLREKEGEKGIRRMAAEYANLSSLLDSAARREEAARVKDKPAAAKVRDSLREMKIPCDSVRVTGTRLRTVEAFGVRLSEISASSSRISATLSEQVGTRLSEPEFLLGGDYAVMKLTSVPRVRIEYAKCTASKMGEKVCGDTVSFFETDDGYFYCLLSDGMGSGRDAALSSRLAAIMLEKLLTVGAEKADALQMVNKALLQKDKEIFATIDLLEIDRYTGTATLIKAGAAPTLLFREGGCRRFESKTPPAGIMRDVIAEKRTFRIRKGDLVLLMSDGVLQVGDPSGSLPTVSPGNAHAVASAVLTAARAHSSCADDMSVCAVRIY
ncbi:MAG: SpoIIE family protein phosphatase [Oscillospiraceae bacterium]|nr:SpoIIE family protein phosphatase [Oscillospiraceae bacterium]